MALQIMLQRHKSWLRVLFGHGSCLSATWHGSGGLMEHYTLVQDRTRILKIVLAASIAITVESISLSQKQAPASPTNTKAVHTVSEHKRRYIKSLSPLSFPSTGFQELGPSPWIGRREADIDRSPARRTRT